VNRNTATITAFLIVIFVLSLFLRDMIRHRLELPSTMGMSPVEVVETYYRAFNDLDHVMMEACLSGRTGREDIDTVTGLFVISRLQQVYELNPSTGIAVFGITDLSIRLLSETGDQASLEADYTLWLPGAEPDWKPDTRPDGEPGLERSTAVHNRDRLELVFKRGLWRITVIKRERLSGFQAIGR
jgi:hypothetical protein